MNTATSYADARERIKQKMRNNTQQLEASLPTTFGLRDSAGSTVGRRAECNRCGSQLAPMGYCFRCDCP